MSSVRPVPPRAGRAEEIGELALVFGLLTAFLAGTAAVAQLERGANRIYGTERDRPSLRMYARAAVLTATAGTALACGMLCIVAEGASVGILAPHCPQPER